MRLSADDAVRLGRFGVVGLLATAVHAGGFALGLRLGLVPTLATLLAFGVAVWVTYWGQRVWVFGRRPRSLWHFGAAAILGAILHAVGMPALLAVGLTPWGAWLALTVLVPLASFLLARWWVFMPTLPS